MILSPLWAVLRFAREPIFATWQCWFLVSLSEGIISSFGFNWAERTNNWCTAPKTYRKTPQVHICWKMNHISKVHHRMHVSQNPTNPYTQQTSNHLIQSPLRPPLCSCLHCRWPPLPRVMMKRIHGTSSNSTRSPVSSCFNLKRCSDRRQKEARWGANLPPLLERRSWKGFGGFPYLMICSEFL